MGVGIGIGLGLGYEKHLAGRECAEDAVECAHVLGLGVPLERGTSVQPSQREHLLRGVLGFGAGLGAGLL